MNTKVIAGVVAVVGVAIGVSGWMQRRAVERDFVRLEHEFGNLERRVRRGRRSRRFPLPR